MITRSGASEWIFSNASSPLRATPASRNSPELSMVSASIRRKKALSSATRTDGTSEGDGTMHHRRDLDLATVHIEPHRAAERTPDCLTQQGDPGTRHGVPRGDDVPFSHLDRPRRGQRGEH